MKRIGSVVQLRGEKVEEYKQFHAAVWPEVIGALQRANVHNYSIYLRRFPDGKHYLFSYFEYGGDDFAADMARLAADPATQKWWALNKPCHEPFPDRAPDEWWAGLEEVFHLD
jgi:L-rhamnose mutarotase